jgi:hypothetical protein
MAANQPKPAPAPLYDGGASLGLTTPKPMEIGALSSPGPTIPQNLRPVAQARPSFADQMNVFQAELDKSTASGPATAPARPKTPEEIDREIRNRGRGNLGVIPDNLKPQAVTDTNNAKLRNDRVNFGTEALNNDPGLRAGFTNAEVGAMNPAGRVRMERQPNGTMSFSGRDVSGAVSYVDPEGKAMPGMGQKGTGWGQTGNVAAGGGAGFISASNPGNDALVQAAQSGDYSGLTPLQQSQANILRQGGTFDASGNLQRRETTEFLAREAAAKEAAAAQPRSGGGGGGVNLTAPAPAAREVGMERLRQAVSRPNVNARLIRDLAQLETGRFTNAADNSTSRANNESTNETQRRGQDMSEQQSLRTAQATAEKNRQDQLNRDREFGLSLTKEQREARTSAESSLGKRLDTFATRMVDGKPVVDPALRARSEEALNSLMARAIDAATKAGDAKLAARIQKEGLAGLDESLVRKTLRGIEVEQKMLETDGPWLWNSTARLSDDPTQYAPVIDPKTGKPKKEEGLIWDKTVLQNGARVNPDILEEQNGIPTNRYQ